MASSAAQDTWDRTEHLNEEAYFASLDPSQRQKVDDAQHVKELKSLQKALPKQHNLSHADLFKLIVWKVEDQAARIAVDRNREII